jgi:hypothetical protein
MFYVANSQTLIIILGEKSDFHEYTSSSVKKSLHTLCMVTDHRLNFL